MVKSVTLRKIVISTSSLVVIGTSIMYRNTIAISELTARFINVIATFALFASIMLTSAIHNYYPEKQGETIDVHNLLQEKPYSLCRHPHYLLLIISQLSIASYSLSFQGLLTLIIVMPTWYILIQVEEAELLNQFGDEYRRYMKEVPAILPLRRKQKHKR